MPGYEIDAPSPQLVADQNRAVHAFNSQPVGDDLGIVYSRWTEQEGWTNPVDILLPVRAGIARIQGAYIDPQGIIHLAFYSGNEMGADIYHARAPATEAGNARAWSPPVLAGEGAGPVSSADLIGDEQGNLFIVYSGRRDGLGLYGVLSEDGGESWSEPVPVFLTYDTRRVVVETQMAVDLQGRVHAVWQVVEGGLSAGIHYAQLGADHGQWSEPIPLAEWKRDENERGGQPPGAPPAILAYSEELLAVYDDFNQHGGAVTRTHRQSTDGGRTWTEPVQPFFEYVGTGGQANFLVDSRGVLHYLFANRTSYTPIVVGIWHSVWTGEQWSSLEAIVSGAAGTGYFDPTGPKSVISQGNVLLVTWYTDPGYSEPDGVWYSYTTLNAPELPVAPTATPRPSPSPTPTASPRPPDHTPTPTAAPVNLNLQAPEPASDGNALAPVALAMVPVSVLLATVAVAFALIRARSR
jgi:hypothetical protein